MSDHEPTKGERLVASVADRARQESVPSVDVSHAVLGRLRQMRPEYAPERPLMWVTAAAVATAAIVLTLSMPYLHHALDPLSVFLEETAASAI
jgi:hypothetical protein